MKPHNLIGSLIVAALVSTTAFAQGSTPATNASLRGVRAAELGFGFVNPNHSSLNVYATNLGVNVPVSANVDLGAALTYGWVEANSDVDTTDLSVSATVYQDFAQVRAFAAVSLGYAWLPGALDDDWIWGARVGAEFDLGSRFTTVLSAGYDDSFDNGSDGAFDGTVRLNYRATDKLLPYVEVSNIEGGDWGAALGVAYAF
ncbi:hypothetical protein [Actomonas aquatica]|uniref:Outer membrane protein beta-barrel domain-containing protein n=1 Tax=Actomonas aquatica TaxID=2866162 RepID=A0ABZ1CE02_9BACT|nr:hypothetical protein [Opitutus sp. WL0086]WRQ89841.1 hypothetical protein K1X11_010530 [Opitutus sp. WL0086]